MPYTDLVPVTQEQRQRHAITNPDPNSGPNPNS